MPIYGFYSIHNILIAYIVCNDEVLSNFHKNIFNGYELYIKNNFIFQQKKELYNLLF